MPRFRWGALCAPLFLFVFVAGPARADQVPVHAALGGQILRTTVDSELARYYLEDYVPGHRTQPATDAMLATLEKALAGSPSAEKLQDISARHGTDLAALMLARALMEVPHNQRLQQELYAETAQLQQARAPPALAGAARYRMLFAPGWLYRSQPETGADFRQPRAVMDRLGLRHELIEAQEDGTIEANAELIAGAVTTRAQSREHIILVSASKAGPEAALALSRLHARKQAEVVAAWINIGGILRGSELADAALHPPLRWFVMVTRALGLKAWGLKSIESMNTLRSRARFDSLRLPPNTLIINYVALPLSGQVSATAQRGYKAMRAQGPNDGLTYALDAIAPGGLTLVGLGLDHYFLDPELDLKTAALARIVIRRLEGRAATQG